MAHEPPSTTDREDRLAALEVERGEALRQIEALTRDFDEIVDGSELVNTDDEHDPEGSTIAFERAMVAALRSSAERRLTAIDDALARLDDDSYGYCTSCGGEIGEERLAAVPGTTTCVACSARGA